MDIQHRKIPQPMLPRGFAGKVTLRIMNIMHSSIYKNAARVLELRPDDDLLEVGCGNGYFLGKYASHVHSVAGLDLSETSIEMARKKHRNRVKAGTAEFVHGEASQLPWEDNRFNVVTSMGSFIGFPRPVEALKEMHRVLRPGGRAIISIEWNAEDGLDHTKEVRQYGMKIWTEDEVSAMMAEAGFTQISIVYTRGLKMPRMMFASGMKP